MVTPTVTSNYRPYGGSSPHYCICRGSGLVLTPNPEVDRPAWTIFGDNSLLTIDLTRLGPERRRDLLNFVYGVDIVTERLLLPFEVCRGRLAQPARYGDIEKVY